MSLANFHPLIQEWFWAKFSAPTPAQQAGWDAIARGRHTLIAAPTGSGKTLAAFLTCIDGLVRQGLEQGLPDATQVVYVSPLKALSNDIQKNLATPLEEIAALAEARGTPLPPIITAVRTGDTPASERQRLAKRPPHILITTPESLYILLTSESGRRGLKQVRTLILDEIHAVADDKRGSHLMLSVERLCALVESNVLESMGDASDGLLPIITTKAAPSPLMGESWDGGEDGSLKANAPSPTLNPTRIPPAPAITRIGLSATQRPIEEMARFLVGNRHIDAQGAPDCVIVDTGHARRVDLAVELPQQELGPIASHEVWAETLDAVAGLVQEHDTTLVFVNTRRLVERVAHQLSERLGEDAVVAHHGSLSRTTRLAAEEKLKHGQVKVCVATASLELGIDIGVVDLVCQIGSPRSIGLLLQRIGRSGHTVGGTPRGRLFPLTRDELVECVGLARAVNRGNLDTFRVPPWPLDVLGQQIVAACAAEEWSEDALFQMCRRAYPYRDLPRDKFDQVVEVLSQGFAPRQGRGGAHLHRDGINRRLTGRRGARIAALTSGGAIPDTADYDVVADPDNTFVGTVNEDFAIESLAGDIFLLGNTPWKIRRVESGRVRVEDAQGMSPTIPFWLGEAPGRTWELSEEITELREALDALLEDPVAAQEWLVAEARVSPEAARQVVAYLEEGKRVLGIVPTARRVVAERFFDESGGMQLVIHAPFGAAINRAWGMALRKRICRTFDFELQASATDDGLNFSLGPNMAFPLAEVFAYLTSRTVEEVLLQAVLQAPIFGTRWRWNASRFLALLRHTGGRKVPAPLQRMRSDDLLAAVFPAQVQCQDNAVPGNIEPPDHPLVFETVRDCLTEAMDLEGLQGVLRAIEQGEIEVHARDTVQPSVFAHQLLNAMPYAFLDDAPLEERRARAVTLRRALPDDARDLAQLDEDAIRRESDNAWPRLRDAHELHDALLTIGAIPEPVAVIGTSPWNGLSASNGNQRGIAFSPLSAWFDLLVAAGRGYRLTHVDGHCAWVAAEGLRVAAAAYPEAAFQPEPPPELLAGDGPSQEDAILSLVRGWAECSGPFNPDEMAALLGLPTGDVNLALAQLEGEGLVLRGSFRPAATAQEFCDRRILARIHRSTIGRLRRGIEPVSQSVLMRFLFRWQNAQRASRLAGEGGLLEAIEKLQGFEVSAGALESEVLAARVAEYHPMLLDRLCLGGEVVWGRLTRNTGSGWGNNGHRGVALSRNTPISLALRESLDWLLDPPEDADDAHAGAAAEVLDVLSSRGACFISDLAARTRRLPSDVEEALWQLAAAGRVTSDSLEALRSRLQGAPDRKRHESRRRQARPYRPGGFSRWSLLEPPGYLPHHGDVPTGDTTEPWARQLLLRYGIVFPELLARERMAPPWRDLVRMYRRLEARGEIRGGRFVAGFVGEQFALPEAVGLLREINSSQPAGRMEVISACDPLNLVGIVTPGLRVPALPGNRVLFRDGAPLASLEKGVLVKQGQVEGPDLGQAYSLLRRPWDRTDAPEDWPKAGLALETHSVS